MTLRGMYPFEDTAITAEITLGNSANITTGSPRTGTRSLSSSAGAAGFTTVAPTGLSASSIVAGMAQIVTTVNAAATCWTLREGATIHCAVGLDATRHLTIYGPAGTVVATSTYTIPITAWFYLEIVATIADSGGTVEVFADGTSVVTYTGDTRNGGTGVVNTIGIRAPNSGASFFTDDLYILDTAGSAPYNARLGDVAIRALYPTAAGDSTQWTPSTGANWSTQDENPSSSTDYVGTGAAGNTDLYAVTDIPTTDLPLAVQQVTYAAKSDAGTPPVMKPVTKGQSGTVREETALTLSTTYQVFKSAIQTTDPDGNALTATRVNAMQAGVRSA